MTCNVDGCDRKSRAREMCTLHYQRWAAHGVTVEPRRPTLAEQGLIPHGTPQGYNHHKCRCERCLAWQRPYAREAMYRKYGITTAIYEQMLADQGGSCAICQQPDPGGKSLHVDHCHSGGAVRALLCGRCNRAIGLLDDDPDRLMAAAAYLLQFTDVLSEENA